MPTPRSIAALLITHGGGAAADGTMLGRIVEVDPETDEVVFDLQVGDGVAPNSWTVDRASRYRWIYEA